MAKGKANLRALPPGGEVMEDSGEALLTPTPEEIKAEIPKRCLSPEEYGVTYHDLRDGSWVEVRDAGTFRCSLQKDKDTGKVELNAVWVAGVLSVIAATKARDKDGVVGIELVWRTSDGDECRSLVPARFAFESSSSLSTWLQDNDVAFQPRELGTIKAYLAQVNPTRRIACYSRTGWHDGVFVVHDRVIGEADAVFQPRDPNAGAATSTRGSHADWLARVAEPACDLPWWRIAMLASFAAPLVKLLGEPSRFFHAVGRTSSGKTIGASVAASVWGCGNRNDPATFVSTWNSTGNALEAAAAAHCDLPLILDEIGEADARTVRRTVYQLAHGAGRGRMTSDATIRRRSHWQGLFISTGEQGLTSKVAEAREETSGGVFVRFLELPVEAGGLAWALDDPARVKRLEAACGRVYGSAGPMFVEWLVTHGYGNTESPECIGARNRLDEIEAELVGAECNVRARRAARGFALLQLAGELAIKAGAAPECIAPQSSVSLAFNAWRTGSSNSTDDMRRIAGKLLAFILAERDVSILSGNAAPHRSRAGSYDGDRVYLLPAAFEALLGGLPVRDFCTAAFRAEAMIPGEGNHLKFRLPQSMSAGYAIDRPRVYCVDVAALEAWVNPAAAS